MASGTGQKFIELTKYRHLGKSRQQRGSPQPPLEEPFDKGGEVVPLPDPATVDTDLKGLIDGRTSVRAYEQVALSRGQLSYLLWCTQGVKRVMPGRATLRTVPSAGARHALDTYVLVNRVEGLAPGLYRYLALEHEINAFIMNGGIAAGIEHACLGQAFVRTSAATFVWVAAVDRMTWRYEERGYRYLFLDAGHVCQNLYLSAESIGCGACAIGAYDDDVMNALLELDGEREFVIYIAAVGKKKGRGGGE